MKPRSSPGLGARLLVALAAGAAMAVFARYEADPAAGAEGWYLAVLATAVLLAAAALAVPPAAELTVGAGLATACVWALPPGPGRGAAMGLLLAATFAVAAVRRLRWEGGGLPFAAAVPLALGAQLLLRGDLLLAPALDLHTLAVFLGLPVAAGAALGVLAARHGAAPALTAAAAALTLAPGWNVATTLALVALAAGSVLAAPARRWHGLAVPFLLAAFAFEPRSGWAAAVAGLALGFPRLALGLAAGGGLAAYFLGAPGPGAMGLLGLALLVPALAASRRESLLPLATALALAAATPWIPDRTVLAAPLALAALGLRTEGWAVAAQRFWSAAVLLGVALAAGYPWLRHHPLSQVLAWAGLERLPAALLPLAVATVLWGLSLLPVFRRPDGSAAPWLSPRSPAFGAAVAALLLAAAVAAHRPAPLRELLPAATAVRLTAGAPRWQGALPAGPRSRAVVIESSLANGAGLPAGTPVALVTAAGGGRYALRAGIETAEWAARRPDVAAHLASPAPEPSLSWVVGSFFAQRYRARFELPVAEGRGALAIERLPDLPPDVEVALHAVGAEP